MKWFTELKPNLELFSTDLKLIININRIQLILRLWLSQWCDVAVNILRRSGTRGGDFKLRLRHDSQNWRLHTHPAGNGNSMAALETIANSIQIIQIIGNWMNVTALMAAGWLSWWCNSNLQQITNWIQLSVKISWSKLNEWMNKWNQFIGIKILNIKLLLLHSMGSSSVASAQSRRPSHFKLRGRQTLLFPHRNVPTGQTAVTNQWIRVNSTAAQLKSRRASCKNLLLT